jgi:hypothetical protein
MRPGTFSTAGLVEGGLGNVPAKSATWFVVRLVKVREAGEKTQLPFVGVTVKFPPGKSRKA